MKRILKLVIFMLSFSLIISCNNVNNDPDVTEAVNNNSIYQNLIPFNTLINTITFDQINENDETKPQLLVPSELKFLYENDSYIDSCCYLSFRANISLDSYTEIVRGYTIKKFVNNPNYHYVEKNKDENISSFSTNFEYNNNNNILSLYVKRYDLYKEDKFQKVSFIINEDNSVNILLLKQESENSEIYQIEQGFVVKSILNLENDSTNIELKNDESLKFIENLNFDITSDWIKGLELFAWQEYNEWKLVLLPGTNILKRVNELKEGLILNTNDMRILIKYYQEKEVDISIVLIEAPSSITSEYVTMECRIENEELENSLKEKLGWK